MVKDKKSKLSKIDKLRRILDNPFDPNNKKLLSKDDKSLETIHRKLSKNKNQLQSTESITEESSNLKPSIKIHDEKEEEIVKKQYEEPRQDVVKEDLIEVEKVESKPEFVETKSEEIVKKPEPEKEDKFEQKSEEFIQVKEKEESQITQDKIKEEIPFEDKKVKIIDFKDVSEEEVYSKTKQGLLSSDKIQIYKPLTILEMWVFTIIIGIVTISSLFLLRISSSDCLAFLSPSFKNGLSCIALDSCCLNSMISFSAFLIFVKSSIMT